LAAYILIIGTFNFVLGYFLALALADPPFLGLRIAEFLIHLKQSFWRRSPLADQEAEEEQDEAGEHADPLPAIAPVSDLPDLWQHALKEDGLQLSTLAAGIIHYLRLEEVQYREQLLTAEARARQAWAVQEPLTMEQLAADLRFVNVDWSRKLRQAAELIEERAGRLGPAQDAALEFSRLMQDQGGQIAEMDREIHALNFRSDGTVACRRMLADLHHLIHLAHVLRDNTQRLLAATCLAEGNLPQINRKLHLDAATRMPGRLALEAMFAENFQSSARPITAARISLDRFGKVNQRLGARAGDFALKSAARYLAELAASQCEKSLVIRLAGDEFLILATEASVEELAAVGEHIRQSFEAAGFNHQGTDFSLTLTVSVAAVAAEATLGDLLERLDTVRSAAVRAGQNRGARWENGAAVLTLPPAIPATARMIQVNSTAA